MLSGLDYSLQAGAVFEGRYEILTELGAGTFGRVYKARQLSTGQEVAVKVLRFRHTASQPESENQVERFRRETRLCVELSHPNIVRVLDSGETEEGTLYATFEFVPGSTLKDVLLEEGKLALRETVHLMSQVLDALSCAHGRGVVHRDLKPENIMVTRTGARRNAMVLDFGLGGFAPEASGWGLPRITRTQEMMGTPCYAAPEQLRGEPPTTRSDLYSWGLILLECLTGKLVVHGASVHEAILKQLGDDPIPIPAEISHPRLRKLLETVTAKRVEKRDATFEGLLRALGSIDAGERASESTLTGTDRTSQGERRQVTVACVRLGISRPDGRPIDLEQLDELVHAEFTLCAELAARGDGRIVSVLGNQALIVFGYHQAHEDDARRAARAGLGIAVETARRSAQLESERGVRLVAHVGVHTGLVIARELRRSSDHASLDLVGPTPQIAMRLAEMAEPSEVLASLDTRRLLRGEIDHEEAGACRLPELNAVLPAFRLTGHRQVVAGVETIQSQRETRLVGRDQPLAQLLDLWKQSEGGRGSIVLMTGEPGIGKSRLLRELRRRVPAQAWLLCQCVAESQNSPLRPIVDLFAASEEPIEALLERHGMDVPSNFPLFATLLSLPLGNHAPLQLTPERQKDLTLNAILTLLLRMSAARPIVFAMEDLHWADPTTLEFANLLVEEVRGLDIASGDDAPRIFVAMTARPHFVPRWSIENVSLIALSRLANREVEEMVAANFSDHFSSPSRRIVDEVVLRSDGIPLFVEEVGRVLLEGLDQSPGGDPVQIEIPGSLRDLLTARLDGVSGSAKETAQLASVLGREFRYELLRTVSHKPESLVRADVRELANSGLVYQRRSARSESHVFKHALVRDSAYESMMRATRQMLHERVANTMRERFPDIERTQPEVIAQHFEQGGRVETAADYWSLAGALALRRAMYVEAVRHFERGQELIRSLPPTLDTRRREIDNAELLGSALVATQGYASPDVEKTWGRAFTLCQELGEEASFRILYGIWGVHFVRSERETSAFLLEAIRRHGRRTNEPISVCMAETAGGLWAFMNGDFTRAREELNKATRWYGDESILESIRNTGYDGRLYSFAYLTWTLGILGELELAVQTRQQMIDLAPESPGPYARAIALGFGLHLAHDMRDVDAAADLSAQAIAHCSEQKIHYFLATSLPIAGWALVRRGRISEGLEQIQSGIALLNAIGMRTSYAYHLSMLAEAHLAQGNVDDGLKAVDEGLALAQILLDRFYEPELNRLKGELLIARGDLSAAEFYLRTAYDMAERQNARLYQLHAAVSLGRLLCDQGRKEDARSLLGGINGHFAQGVDSAELQSVQALVAEM